ncbi:MAG TPA: hypothetical protein VHZ75_11320 [Solirubrobacteraceae bacterium]|jgi:hypothetical protein|nr:hypothetical protein [Solirubrobacteraceae bacterium]
MRLAFAMLAASLALLACLAGAAGAAGAQTSAVGPTAQTSAVGTTADQGASGATGPTGATVPVAPAIGVPGQTVSVVQSGGAFDQATSWMTDAATWITSRIQKLIGETKTPELTSSWYRQRFGAMAALGLGLSALVAMIALGSAALRRDASALGATLIGMFRAGLGTGLVLALTVMALGVADGVTNVVAGDGSGHAAAKFWSDVAAAWGSPNYAGFGSSAIAFLFASVQVLAGLAVWIELLVREAGIYVAVLFMPAALAASIWPRLRAWQARLTTLLFVLIALKPVMIVVLSLTGSAAGSGGNVQHDTGLLVAAVVILMLAALTPWALMALVSSGGDARLTAEEARSRSRASDGGARIGGGLGRSGTAGLTTIARGGGHAGGRAGRSRPDGGGAKQVGPGRGPDPAGAPVTAGGFRGAVAAAAGLVAPAPRAARRISGATQRSSAGALPPGAASVEGPADV